MPVHDGSVMRGRRGHGVGQRGLAALLGLGALLAGARVAEACSCPLPLLADSLAGAHAVFEGTVREVRVDPKRRELSAVRFEVRRRWKGAVTAAQVVRTVAASSCSHHFGKGETHLVFAATVEGLLMDGGPCGGTDGPLSSLTDDALGPGLPPLPNAGPPEVLASDDPAATGCQMAAPAGAAGTSGLLGLLLLSLSLARVRW